MYEKSCFSFEFLSHGMGITLLWIFVDTLFNDSV